MQCAPVPQELAESFHEFMKGFKNYRASLSSVEGLDNGEGKEALTRKGVLYLQDMVFRLQHQRIVKLFVKGKGGSVAV